MQVIFVTGHERKGTLHWGGNSCPAVLGYGGMGKSKEGDGRTPLGCFAVKDAYGILPDPGCHITYTQITPEMYWCGDSSSPHYNRPVYCTHDMPPSYGEHMMDYVKEYRYLLDIGYNAACEAGRGSGIFLHCCGDKDYTHGCIAVEERYMVNILQWIRPGAHIVIKCN